MPPDDLPIPAGQHMKQQDSSYRSMQTLKFAGGPELRPLWMLSVDVPTQPRAAFKLGDRHSLLVQDSPWAVQLALHCAICDAVHPPHGLHKDGILVDPRPTGPLLSTAASACTALVLLPD